VPACLSQFSEFLIKGFPICDSRLGQKQRAPALAVDFNGKAMMKGSLSLL
jgi:hypothetical protein